MNPACPVPGRAARVRQNTSIRIRPQINANDCEVNEIRHRKSGDSASGYLYLPKLLRKLSKTPDRARRGKSN